MKKAKQFEENFYRAIGSMYAGNDATTSGS